jgi:glycosyltransferase involved in cell wall biosynthesis
LNTPGICASTAAKPIDTVLATRASFETINTSFGDCQDLISIVLPAKNEGAVLATLLPRLLAAQPQAEIIVVDDGSVDRTVQVCAEAGVRSVTQPYSMGNGAAIKRGTREAQGDILVFMDADGQHDPADISRLIARLEQGYDMVVGARDWSGQV